MNYELTTIITHTKLTNFMYCKYTNDPKHNGTVMVNKRLKEEKNHQKL